MRRLASWSSAILTATALAFITTSIRAQNQPFDILIRRGTVVDGSGARAARADIGIRDGRIVSIGQLSNATGRELIDAAGLIVAPGFIDVHTHADDIAETPRAENFVRMGVTSVVAGNCGGSALDVADALANIRQTGIAINYAVELGEWIMTPWQRSKDT